MSAPPGTRTPNPRIKSPNPVISSGFGLGQRVSFPQVSNESPGRRVPSSAAPVHGHRAPMEHRDRQSVLHRRTRWGSGGAVKAADFGSGGSVVTVTWSRDLERPGAVGSVGAGRGAVAQERRVVQPTAGVEKTNAIESPGDVQVLPSTVVDPMPAAVSPHRRCLPAGRRGKCPAIGCRSVTGIHRVAEQRWRAELRPPITHIADVSTRAPHRDSRSAGAASHRMPSPRIRALRCRCRAGRGRRPPPPAG